MEEVPIKAIPKSINGIDLTTLTAEEKYQLGLKDGISLTIEQEQEMMKAGFAAEGDYLKGLIDGIHRNPQQQEASEQAKLR